MSSSQVAIVILAAGESARMGQPKQLLQYAGKSLIRRAVETALGAHAVPVFVVLGAHEAAIRTEVAELPVAVVVNTDWSEGMASSIRSGLQALPEVSAALFILCDQPRLTSAFLLNLISPHQQTGQPIVASEYGDSLGVPALFHQSLFAELLQLRGAQGAKKVIQAHPNDVLGIPFEGGEVDVDTPEQYNRLKDQVFP